MRPEYDFGGGVRGKYAARYREGTNVVVLDPDIADAFPNAGAVNRALRALLTVIPTRRPRRRSA
jgi:soluble cytochrome b562